MKEGQHRANCGGSREFHELNPTDAQTLGMLGESQRLVGFTEEAKEAYLKVIDMLEPKPTGPAVRTRAIAISPGEILEGEAGRGSLTVWSVDEAHQQWVKLGADSRRRGST